MAVNPMLVGGIGVGVTAVAVTGGLYAGGVIGGSGNANDRGPGSIEVVKEYRGPTWTPASSDKNASYATGTYVEKYKKYLVGAEANTEWWTWSYNNRYKDAQKTTGKSFETGITDGTKLKEACQKAYKGSITAGTPAPTEINGESSSDSAGRYPEAEVWLFCSPSKTKIKNLKEMTDEKNKYTTANAYGSDTNYIEKLVSTEDEGSEWFWELKEEEFFKANANPALSTATNSKFRKLWTETEKKKYEKKPDSKLIKGLCKEAYKTAKPSGDNVEYPKADVGKFCTLSGETLA